MSQVYPLNARAQGLVAALIVCALVGTLAGCADRRPRSSSSDHTGRPVALRLATCLRGQGIDPLAPGPQGYDATHPIADGGDRARLRAAAKACGLPPLPNSRNDVAKSAAPSYPAGTQAVTGRLNGALYRVELPSHWNGTLLLWSHGYQLGGRPQATDPGALTTRWLLDNGYAIAASGYRRTGWAIAEALPDQITLLDHFTRRYGQPRITIAAGESLGGLISEGLAERHPERFAGALSLCGVSGGGLGFWNQALDAALAVRTLLAPHSPLELTRLHHPVRDRRLLAQALDRASQTPAGRARLALAAALLDLPAWRSSRPPRTTAARAEQLIRWLDEQLPQYAIPGRLDLEQRSRGNPSWTTGIDYRHQLQLSVDHGLVQTLYRQAHLNLSSDLRRLNQAPRIHADRHAAAYLAANISPDRLLEIPLLTLHTTGDGVVPVANEQALAGAVGSGGGERFLRQLFVERAGHCSFTAAEQITALNVLLTRIRRHGWPSALDPASLDNQARRLGSNVNTDDESDAHRGTPVAPHFVHTNPPPFLRPSDDGGA